MRGRPLFGAAQNPHERELRLHIYKLQYVSAKRKGDFLPCSLLRLRRWKKELPTEALFKNNKFDVVVLAWHLETTRLVVTIFLITKIYSATRPYKQELFSKLRRLKLQINPVRISSIVVIECR